KVHRPQHINECGVTPYPSKQRKNGRSSKFFTQVNYIYGITGGIRNEFGICAKHFEVGGFGFFAIIQKEVHLCQQQVGALALLPGETSFQTVGHQGIYSIEMTSVDLFSRLVKNDLAVVALLRIANQARSRQEQKYQRE